MDAAIVVAIVAACAAMLTFIIASIMSWRSTVYNFQKPKHTNILEEQYKKVISPLHEIFSFDTDDIEIKKTKAYTIFKENYHLVPREIIKLFADYENGKDTLTQLNKLVEDCDVYSRKKLGYSQVNSRDSIGKILGSTYISEIGFSVLSSSIRISLKKK